MKIRHLIGAAFVLAIAAHSAWAVIVTPVSVTSTIAGDAGSSVDYLLADNPAFAAAGLQMPVGTATTLPDGAALTDALGTFGELSGGGQGESWTRPTGEGNPVFSFDLGSEREIGSILLWQYGNNGGGANRNGNHTRDFELIFHTTAEGPTFDFASAGGGEAVEFSGTMERAGIDELGTTELNPAQFFGFSATETARYVGLRIATNYLNQPGLVAGGDRYGLGEVRFATELVAPEPMIVNVEINRDNGQVTLSNSSASPINFAGLGLTSADGALDPSNWLSITENYDSGADGGVSDDPWVVFSSTPFDLSEGTLGTATLAASQSIDLGEGTWLRNPNEDVAARYLEATTGEVIAIEVDYVGTTQIDPYEIGDLNFDGSIDELDWPIYRNGYRADLSSLSPVQAYNMGDLNGDGVNNAADFGIFKDLYETNNPGASFAALLAGSQVPEPTAWALAVVGVVAVSLRRLGRKAVVAIATVASVAICVATSQAALPTLVSNWTLDADATDSAASNDGTATDVTFGIAGANSNTGTAAGFNGSSSTIEVPYTADLNPESFTVSLWAQAASTDGFQSPLTSRDDFMTGVSTHGYIIYNGSDGNWQYWTGDGDPGWATVVSDPVSIGTWTHLAASFDADTNTKSFYIDGVNVANTTDQGYSVNGTVESEAFHIGSGNDLGDQFFFDGNIDDVGVFNGVLSQAEIQNVAANGIAAFELLRLELEINTNNGIARLLNSAGTPLDIDQYEVLSNEGSLSTGGWDSIQANGQNGLPQGDGSTGNGWEVLGVPTSNFVGEAYLQDSSVIGTADVVNLGNLFDTSVGVRDVEFFYRLSTGTTIQGIVNYVTPEGLAGDYNGDGTVDAADYTVWRDNLGGDASAFADGSRDPGASGPVGSGDYDFWRSNFGSTAGALDSETGAVPEPSSALLVLFAAAGLGLIAVRRQMGLLPQRRVVRAAAGMIVAGAVVGSTALATVTNDRDYQFGDPGSADATLAPPTVTTAADVGEGNPMGFVFNGITSTGDETGPSGAFFDLQVFGATYSSAATRPGAGASDFAANFNGTSDYLQAARLGLPSTSDAALGGDVAGPLNYNGIANRGFQFWARPDQAGSGSAQSLVADTEQHGVRITAGGNWEVQYAGALIDTGTAVNFDAWSHVMLVRPFGGTNGARFYVDGVLVEAAPGGYFGDDNTPLVVGANTGATPGTADYYDGLIDDLELFVMGDNSNDPGPPPGEDYGTFDLATDNEFVADALASITTGDLTGDDRVLGDGSGGPNDDVAVFIANWGFTNDLNGVVAGDLVTRAQGDLNLDGITDFADWFILRANHEAPAGLDLVALLGGSGQVPEPSSVVLVASLAGVAVLIRRRRMT